jgi:hypothetical protein
LGTGWDVQVPREVAKGDRKPGKGRRLGWGDDGGLWFPSYGRVKVILSQRHALEAAWKSCSSCHLNTLRASGYD